MSSIARTNARIRSAGFTLVEMMIVVAIIGLMLGAAVLTIRNVARSELRSAASRTAATLRFAFDRATMTGDTLRLGLDLDKGELWLEASKDRAALRTGREQHHAAGSADDDPQPEKKKKAPMLPFGLGLGGAEGEGEGEGDEGGLMGFDSEEFKKQYERDLAPVERPKARFMPVKGKRLKLSKAIAIDAVVTPRLVEPVTDGKAYVYFFPGGHAEPAIVYFTDSSEEVYSVALHPLTGRAKVHACRLRIPADFDVEDDKRKRGNRGDECAERGR